MKIEYSLFNALPRLVIERVGDDWHASIEIDWTDSFESTFWPEFLLDADDKLNGEFPEWIDAQGEIGTLGEVACTMKFPDRLYLGKLPRAFVAHSAYDTEMAFAKRDAAELWAHERSNVKEVNPSDITVEQVMESAKMSANV